MTPGSSNECHESQYDRWSSRMSTVVSTYFDCVQRLVNRVDC